MTAPVVDVLVVGAGPSGSAVAGALARQGRSVLLVESRAHPRPKACAEYASPRIAEELQRLAVPGDRWRHAARPLRGMRVVRGADAVLIRYGDRNGPRSAWGLDRQAFDAALAGWAVRTGATLLERTSFLSASFVSGTWRAELRGDGGRTDVAARWLVGADGARSRVARVVGAEREVRAPRRLGLVAHYEGHPDLAGHGEMHVARRHYVGLAPLPDGRLNVGMAVPIEGNGTAEHRFTDAIAALPAVADRLRGLRRLTPIRGAGPIGHRVARAAGPRWLLVGDAAGFIDPFTGEGIYRALRSARAAADAFADGDDGAAERYLARRRGAFAAKDALTWTVQAMLAAPPVLGYAVRRLDARPRMADRLGAALGDCRPASDALSPAFLVGLLRP